MAVGPRVRESAENPFAEPAEPTVQTALSTQAPLSPSPLPATTAGLRSRAAFLRADEDPASLMAGLVDALPAPALLIDGEGAVLCANRQAARLVPLDPSLRISGGRLWLGAAHRFIDAAWIQGEALLAGLDPAGPVALTVAAAGGPGVVQLVAARVGLPADGTGWLLTLYVSAARRAVSRRALQRLLRLSPAEAALVEALFAGLKPPAAARRLGIGRETAKSQLSSIFRKCGVESQAQLLQAIAAGPFFDDCAQPGRS